jgi:RNA polymerase sigma-70 factor (ECF subfamily)
LQDALLKILNALDSFRGESKYTAWAHEISVNVALSELRRLRWQDVSLHELIESQGLDFMPDVLIDPSAGPDQQAIQSATLGTLQRIIRAEPTDKQRQALVAARMHGMPLAEVARRMGTNRNASYKLLHDARQKLKTKMQDEGFSPEAVLAAFET